MQQYIETNKPGITLTIFHTFDGMISFNIEHYGTVVLNDTDKIKELKSGSTSKIKISGRSVSNRHNVESKSSAELSKTSDGYLFELTGYSYGEKRNIDITITDEQMIAICDAIGSGTSEVGYDVVWVNENGEIS